MISASTRFLAQPSEIIPTFGMRDFGAEVVFVLIVKAAHDTRPRPTG
jgi:hypothetical protein